MESKLDDIFGYVQERCLWQFASRTWDRHENIDGVLAHAQQLLTGKQPELDTPMQRIFYADAKSMVDDLRDRFAWIKASDATEIATLLDQLKVRLVDNVITKSTNRELTDHLY